MQNMYTRFQPIEQARWNESNIDTLFVAGYQDYINQFYSFNTAASFNKYYFNIIQQPVNMITGYQRQNRKGLMFQNINGGDVQTTDQYTKLISNLYRQGEVYETFSRGCELATTTGMVLAMPYLDFTGEDPAQGDFKLKIWEYNSFLMDPYWRSLDMSDANMVWCQEFITKEEAASRFVDYKDMIRTMTGAVSRNTNFYFLPENSQINRQDLLVLSYIWYKWKRKKKRLFSRSRQQFFDFTGNDQEMIMLVQNVRDLEEVTVEVPTWKLACVLNDKLVYRGLNPLKNDRCPFVPIYWNYDPQINIPNLRVRSLVRTMRDSQFLLNHKIITNNDIAAATINAGWKRKVGAVANEDNLKRSGQGYDVIINPEFEMSDVEKIIPTSVPQSDLELANQMMELMYHTSGVNLENWAAQKDKNISTLTQMMKQAANLMVFQKYFDQWDLSWKLLGELSLEIALNNFNEPKIENLIGEQPSPFFYSKIMTKYNVVVEEADLTPTQQNLQAQQMLEINQMFGREVFPPSKIIPKLKITGKAEIIQDLQQQEQQMAAVQEQQMLLGQTIEQAKLQELYSKAASNIAMARERHGRAEADIGLFEERLSEISRNRALATKDKVESIEKLIMMLDTVGREQTMQGAIALNDLDRHQELNEDREKIDAKKTSLANDFLASIMSNNQQMGQEPVRGNNG